MKSGMNLPHAGTVRNNNRTSSPGRVFLHKARPRRSVPSAQNSEDCVNHPDLWNCMPGPTPNGPGLIRRKYYSFGESGRLPLLRIGCFRSSILLTYTYVLRPSIRRERTPVNAESARCSAGPEGLCLVRVSG